LLVCLHLNSWMLVPHIQHDSPLFSIASNSDDLDSFFEYVDEILLSNIDETPDHEENDGQTLDEVAKQDYCPRYHLPIPNQFNVAPSSQVFKKHSTSDYKERISLDIVMPPPDFI